MGDTPAAAAPGFHLNCARALFDGAAYAEMVALLERARRSVRMEMFLFGGPHADRMIDLLALKRDAGLDVRVTLDRAMGVLPVVRWECRAAYRRLRELGIDAVLSDRRPLPDSPRRAPVAHNKFLVADEGEALVGGMNVGSLFFRHHDVMIHLTGSTAGLLAAQFDHDRRFALSPEAPRPLCDAGADLAPFDEIVPPPSSCQSGVRLLGTGVGRRTTGRALLHNLRAVRSSLRVAMCEMGDTALLDEVIAAHRRGADVRVLLDPMLVEEYLPPWLGPLRRLPPTGVLNAGAVARLLRAGVDVRLYRTGPDFGLMHLKMAVFDGRAAVVGSTNWTRGGLEWVGETDVELHGGAVIGEMAAQFDRDWRDRSAPAPYPSGLSRTLYSLYERTVQ